MMNGKLKTTTTTLSVLAGLFALVVTAYAVRNKKEISKVIQGDVEQLKERSALLLHAKFGYPIYNYIKKKENIPY
jgi:hypothetical protein